MILHMYWFSRHTILLNCPIIIIPLFINYNYLFNHCYNPYVYRLQTSNLYMYMCEDFDYSSLSPSLSSPFCFPAILSSVTCIPLRISRTLKWYRNPWPNYSVGELEMPLNYHMKRGCSSCPSELNCSGFQSLINNYYSLFLLPLVPLLMEVLPPFCAVKSLLKDIVWSPTQLKSLAWKWEPISRALSMKGVEWKWSVTQSAVQNNM